MRLSPVRQVTGSKPIQCDGYRDEYKQYNSVYLTVTRRHLRKVCF